MDYKDMWVQELIDELDSDDPKEREQAATALGKRGHQAVAAVPALISVVDDEDEYLSVICSAAWALGEIGDLSAAGSLSNTWKETEFEEECRTAAYKALERISEKTDVPMDDLLSMEHTGMQRSRAISEPSAVAVRYQPIKLGAILLGGSAGIIVIVIGIVPVVLFTSTDTTSSGILFVILLFIGMLSYLLGGFAAGVIVGYRGAVHGGLAAIALAFLSIIVSIIGARTSDTDAIFALLIGTVFAVAIAGGLGALGGALGVRFINRRGRDYFYLRRLKRGTVSTDAKQHFRTAMGLYDNGQFADSIEEFNETIRLDPSLVLAYSGRAFCYVGQGDYKHAIEDFNEAIRLNPEYKEAYYNRGCCYSELKEYKRAIEDFNEAIRLAPEYEKSFNNRGYCYDELGQHERAIEDYGEAIRLNPEYQKAYANRAVAYTYMNKDTEAQQDVDKAIELGFDTAELEGMIKEAKEKR